MTTVRNLVVILGDQMEDGLSALDNFDPSRDVVWMAESQHEATYVWSHKKRLVLFFSAMRHHRDALASRGFHVEYHALRTDARHDSGGTFADVLTASVNRLHPDRLVMTECGDHRVREMLGECARANKLALQMRPDRHFYCDLDAFNDWADGRKRLVLEDFYREMRRHHDILMQGNQPVGGAWNFDKQNRKPFGAAGPANLPLVRSFNPDAITREVIEMVATRFAEHPGDIDGFDLPVTRNQACIALQDFIDNRLANFGPYQDALWTDLHFAYHSRLSAALNMHLLNPRECVDAAVNAYEAGKAPINSVEGFVRQVLGWREFVRGIYWREMPAYADHNALGATLPVPAAFWDGNTDMACVGDAMANVLHNGYAHHIQRLMVLGLFSLVAGVNPRAFHDWHMAMYLDAIDWVSLPNALGMSQFGDGGLLGTKPYCASGNYINNMSNYCKHCRFDYKQATGNNSCPITTLYWDFLDRHAERFSGNQRMVFQLKNLEKKRVDEDLMAQIRQRAATLKAAIEAGERI